MDLFETLAGVPQDDTDLAPYLFAPVIDCCMRKAISDDEETRGLSSFLLLGPGKGKAGECQKISRSTKAKARRHRDSRVHKRVDHSRVICRR